MSNYTKPYFVGIGGTGISNIAWYYIKRGIKVRGSDGKSSPITDELTKAGAEVLFNQEAGNISKDTVDAVFYSQAVLGGAGKAEVDRAEELGIPTFRNAAGYWEVIGKFKDTIAITGAHGKTTTTALSSIAFTAAGLDPVCIIGAPIKEFNNTSFRDGAGKHFIVEACEYREQFLGLTKPKSMVILNIDHDHPDYYKDLQEVQEAFVKLAKQVDTTGFILACNDDPNARDILPKLKETNVQVFTYGKDETSDFVITILPRQNSFGAKVQIKIGSLAKEVWPSIVTVPNVIEIEESLIGEHNGLNTAAAFITLLLSSPQNAIAKLPNVLEALNGFTGSSRRQEYIGKYEDVVVYDDYAHHPTQLHAVISAFKKQYPRLPVIFESHDYVRTRELFDEFVTSFDDVDRLYLFPVYRVPGRNTDSDVASVDIEEMARKIRDRGVDVKLIKEYSELPSVLTEVKSDGYLILLNLGAGPLTWELRKLLSK